MRDKKSVWMLIVHSSIYKVIAVIAAVIAVQSVLFWLQLSKNDIIVGELRTLKQVIEDSHVLWICAAGFLLMTASLCLTGCEFGSRQGYMINRLSVSEKQVFITQAVYNAMCFFIFWAGQVTAALVCCMNYLRFADPSVVNEQILFLSFYQSDFWHNLLPMADVSRTIRNIVLVIALGIGSAAVPVFQRRRRMPLVIVVLLALVILFFTRPMGDFTNDMMVIGIAAAAGLRGVVAAHGCMKEELS